MKLIQLSMKNITSFKGIHEIDFSFLNEENLFAITGHTGTGKSSILTAISLALYGKNYKKALSSNDFVSLGASDAFAKLIFKHNHEIYTAVWEIKLKKKDQTLLKGASPKRYLAKNDVLLDCSAEQLLNLSFEQFTKTVILNQGEFSKFLTSTFSERRSILEKLHGCEQLAIMGKFLSSQLKDWETQLATTKTFIDNTQIYSKEEIDQFNQVMVSTQKQVLEYETYFNFLSKQQSFAKDLWLTLTKSLEATQQLIKKESEYEEALAIFQKENTDLNHLNTTISTHKKDYQTQAPQLQQAIKYQQIIKSTSLQIDVLNQQLQVVKNHLAEKQARKTYLLNKIKSNDELLLIQNQQDPRLFDCDFDLNLAQDLLNQLQKHTNEFQLLAQSDQLNQAQILKTETKISEAQHSLWLEDNIHKDQIIALNALTPDLYYQQHQTLLGKYHTAVETNKYLETLILKKQTITTDLNHQSTELVSLTKKASLIKENLQMQLAQLKENALLDAILLCRHESNQLGRCLVCEKQLDTRLDITPGKHTLNQALVEKQKDELNTLTENIIRFEELGKRLGQDLALTNQEYAKLSKDHLHPDMVQSKLGNLEKIIQNIENIKKNLLQSQSKIESLSDFLKKEQIELNNLIQIKHNNAELIKSKTASINFIKNKIAQDFPRYHILLNDAFDLIKADQSLVNQHSLLTKENIVLQDELNALEADLQSGLQQKNNCSLKIHDLQVENLENIKHLNTLTNESDPEQKLLKLQRELATLEQSLTLKVQDTREKERHKDQLLDKIKNLQHDQKDLNLLQLELITHLKTSALNITRPTITEDIYPLFESYQKAYQKIIQIDVDQITLQLPTIVEIFIKESLIPLQETIKSSIQNCNVLLIESKLKIQNQMEKEKLLAQYQNKYQQIQKKFLTNLDLFKVIGVSDFRNFVNSFIEKKLLIYTNHELKKLYLGRYEITATSGPNGNEFFILDHYHNGQLRKIHTLSGGEIFLVSLAMALSLSEMSKGQTDIESFFIDEGFGNLDQDSIDDALNVLYKIKGQGKQIGIISHIHELTSKISINIDLLKSPQGESSINIVYN
ncbi:MAG: hypothetical protein A2381_06355 [Bdellovibrionales bacterium RIFOXYB1_FULL_37_110]|nr:MAG: hypothetical protein A2181_08375 [Bdellovibrionales bacterium RIFOXYA1_FULL_38_20]OFZ50163.1 MAG: hypothetical protein A2417_19205 [Bdellovibrionales bacterium RIFOXYC1_FULL_37_79]OFZ57600.1 MAG: hypothetical protein A2381_06355 [Bdellovibrionales bacterium RIFOXYB1_FULL_37_110]OFZ61367.1 MAG: hypothetical protein A2577_00720 [Bdellovibrionales bacterium RIFOXYD1_FULL_36_51]